MYSYSTHSSSQTSTYHRRQLEAAPSPHRVVTLPVYSMSGSNANPHESWQPPGESNPRDFTLFGSGSEVSGPSVPVSPVSNTSSQGRPGFFPPLSAFNLTRQDSTPAQQECWTADPGLGPFEGLTQSPAPMDRREGPVSALAPLQKESVITPAAKKFKLSDHSQSSQSLPTSRQGQDESPTVSEADRSTLTQNLARRSEGNAKTVDVVSDTVDATFSSQRDPSITRASTLPSRLSTHHGSHEAAKEQKG